MRTNICFLLNICFNLKLVQKYINNYKSVFLNYSTCFHFEQKPPDSDYESRGDVQYSEVYQSDTLQPHPNKEKYPSKIYRQWSPKQRLFQPDPSEASSTEFEFHIPSSSKKESKIYRDKLLTSLQSIDSKLNQVLATAQSSTVSKDNTSPQKKSAMRYSFSADDLKETPKAR